MYADDLCDHAPLTSLGPQRTRRKAEFLLGHIEHHLEQRRLEFGIAIEVGAQADDDGQDLQRRLL